MRFFTSKYKKEKTNSFVLSTTLAYTALLIYWMFFGFERITYTDYNYNLIPFKAICSFFEANTGYVKNMSDMAKKEFWYFAVNIFGNIGVFIPFGILLPILFNGCFKKACVVFGIGILMLETAQLISRRGVFDVDDILLNTIGFIIGYAMLRRGDNHFK